MARNIPVGAAIKVALGQAKDIEDLKACDECSDLWTHDLTAFMPIEGDTKSLVGSYVAWFQKWARMFRSGKSYGAEKHKNKFTGQTQIHWTCNGSMTNLPS